MQCHVKICRDTRHWIIPHLGHGAFKQFQVIASIKTTVNKVRGILKPFMLYFQRLAKHVMNVHLNALQMTEEPAEGEIDLMTLKKYIGYCRMYVLVILKS